MDEVLRRDYLEAMEIPVWIPRADAEALEACARQARAQDSAALRSSAPAGAALPAAPARVQQPAPAVRGPADTGTPVRRGQALLGDAEQSQRRAPAAGPPLRAVPREAPATAAGSGGMLCVFLARAGATLLIDDAPESRPARGSVELLRALAYTLERQPLASEPQYFAWPPRGVAFDPEQARDALLALAGKPGAEPLQRLVLMGEAPARALLGWSEREYAARPLTVQRLEALGCAVVVTPTTRAMLTQPSLKRLAWQTLRLVLPGHG